MSCMGSGIIEKFEEKELPVLLMRPGTVLIGVHVRGGGDAGQMLDLLNDIVGGLVETDIIYWYRRAGGSTLIVMGATDNIEEVERRVSKRSREHGLEAKVWAPKARGVVYDVFSYPLNVVGEPVFLLRHSDIASVIENIVSRFKEPGKTLIYYLGFDCGVSFADWIIRMFERVNLDRRETYTAGLAIARAMGGALSKVESMSEDLISIEVYESLESQVSSSYYDGCYLIKGFLEGYTRAILEVEVEGEEVKCVKRGHGKCEFKLHIRR